jgi:hypothetical protein
MTMTIKHAFTTTLLTLITINCLTSVAHAQDPRKVKAVKAYYNGFVDKSWDVIAAQLADGFTFTSPANDNDHIPLEKFKAECFPTSKYTKSVSFIKWFQSGDQLALLVQITTTDNKIVRNVDVYDFDSAGKIKAIEVFFGPGIGYPGSKK